MRCSVRRDASKPLKVSGCRLGLGGLGLSSTAAMAAYSDALVLLGTAGVVVPLLRRWGLSPVLGYLGAGAILGPLGLGSISGFVPGLAWFTVTDAANLAGIAELGIVFLLFLIG